MNAMMSGVVQDCDLAYLKTVSQRDVQAQR